MADLQPQLMSVHELFSNTFFEVPDYQRAYAWEKKQCLDLWEDICDGMRTKTVHFLGTIVVMKTADKLDSNGRPLKGFDVVDGQQRLTTLSLLMLAVYKHVKSNNENVARGIWEDFIKHEDNLPRITLGGLNREYFDKLLLAFQTDQDKPVARRSSNQLLLEAVKEFETQIEGWLEHEPADADLLQLASYVRNNVKVVRFVTDSKPLAIKTFQTVNDRGKPLSLLEKSKSLLMFYLTRYLDDNRSAVERVEKAFGRVFENYDTARELAKGKVAYLTSPQFRFNEDEFLRYTYHYSFNDLLERFGLEFGYEYWITPDRILGDFLKGACLKLRNRPGKLRDFILAWCKDLLAVSDALVRLLRRTNKSDSYKRLFWFQAPSASVYPLLVAAEARGILDERMLHAIAILDLRVYQVRGTDPKAELYRNALAPMKKTRDGQEIRRAILRYCQEFGSDQELNSILRGPVFRQSFTKYVLWNFATAHDKEGADLDYELFSKCEIEHIFPQDPKAFEVTTFGFKNAEDYKESNHLFGNLILLEKKLNKEAQNFPPSAKVSVYTKSKLHCNHLLGIGIQDKRFRRKHVYSRTDEIVKFFSERWRIPDR